MEEKNQSFTEMEVWKKGRTLNKELKDLKNRFPPEEKYRLSEQIIRSSRSSCADIAEGHGRFTYKYQLYFCIQARGSLSETLNHLIEALDYKYISQEQCGHFKLINDEVGRLLNGNITISGKNLN